MTVLQSYQEAALNAAGEVLAELKRAGAPISLSVSDYVEGFRVWGYAGSASGDAIWGKAETLAAAAAECLAGIEAAKLETPKLKSAAEAVDAIKELVGDNPELLAKIEALPVKR